MPRESQERAQLSSANGGHQVSPAGPLGDTWCPPKLVLTGAPQRSQTEQNGRAEGAPGGHPGAVLGPHGNGNEILNCCTQLKAHRALDDESLIIIQVYVHKHI